MVKSKKTLTALPLFKSLDLQITEVLNIVRDFSWQAPASVSQILFCGMGGSATSGDILRVLADRFFAAPIIVHRFSELPRWVDKNTLCILSSYSGNTDEVLFALRQVLERRSSILMITSGGKLRALAAEHDLPCLRIPSGLPPRFALGYLTFSLIALFKRTGRLPISDQEIQEVISVIRKTSPTKARNLAKQIANRFVSLYPVVGILEPAAIRWRTQLAENSKAMASYHEMPEMFHNEIEAWRFPKMYLKNSASIFFVDRDDPAWIQKKRRVVQKWIRAGGGMTFTVESEGEGPLARLFSAIALGDIVSLELARLYKVDPVPVARLEALKKITP